MSSEPDTLTPPAPPGREVLAERKRVMDALCFVIDDCLKQWETVGHAIAEKLVKAFCRELVALNRFIRQGQPLEKFLAARRPRAAGEEELPLAEEVK